MVTEFLGITGRKFKHVLMAIFSVVIFLIPKVPMAEAQFSEAGVGKFKVPLEAPDFTLKGLEGQTVSLKELRGKVVILNFFTIW